MALDPAEIHYGIRGQRFGPIDLHTFVDRLRAGQVSGDDFVWDEDLDDWVPLHRYGVLLASLHEELPDEIDPDDPRLHALDTDLDATATELQPAGFGLRLLAFLIDDVILIIPMAIWTMVFQDMTGMEPVTLQMVLEASEAELDAMLDQLTLVTAGGFVIRGIYHSLLESSTWQATIGKRAVGIQVTDERGARISLGRAVARHFGRLLCQITFMIGYLMILFTERGQGLHDRVAGTLVVRNRK
jgi:uncharacterized RDD family membrane protein YckC